uniref:Uncharacterized protein n=1 Tax=Oreochromis aureus TaxID=47969 RepID=A0AAZ1Y062_OREAU
MAHNEIRRLTDELESAHLTQRAHGERYSGLQKYSGPLNFSTDLKTAVHKRCPSNLTELELFCKEEWARISVSRCAKLVETYPKRLAAVIAAKGGSTKY